MYLVFRERLGELKYGKEIEQTIETRFTTTLYHILFSIDILRLRLTIFWNEGKYQLK
jgi:hypothetical protein